MSAFRLASNVAILPSVRPIPKFRGDERPADPVPLLSDEAKELEALKKLLDDLDKAEAALAEKQKAADAVKIPEKPPETPSKTGLSKLSDFAKSYAQAQRVITYIISPMLGALMMGALTDWVYGADWTMNVIRGHGAATAEKVTVGIVSALAFAGSSWNSIRQLMREANTPWQGPPDEAKPETKSETKSEDKDPEDKDKDPKKP